MMRDLLRQGFAVQFFFQQACICWHGWLTHDAVGRYV